MLQVCQTPPIVVQVFISGLAEKFIKPRIFHKSRLHFILVKIADSDNHFFIMDKIIGVAIVATHEVQAVQCQSDPIVTFNKVLCLYKWNFLEDVEKLDSEFVNIQCGWGAFPNPGKFISRNFFMDDEKPRISEDPFFWIIPHAFLKVHFCF